MAEISVVFSFTQGTSGWTEKYFRTLTSSNLNDYYQDAILLFQKGMVLFGAQTLAQYMRISQEGLRGDSLLFGIEPGTVLATQSEISSKQNVCALFNCADVTRNYQKKIYVRGIWRSVVGSAGNYTPTSTYTALVNAFTAELRAKSWGWMSSDRPVVVRALAQIVQNADGTVNLTTVNGPNNWATFGVNQQIRISGVLGNAQLNGPAVVIPQSATIANTLRRIPLFATSNTGSIRYSTKTFRAVDFATVTRTGSHDTGRPILQPRGRQRARTRG